MKYKCKRHKINVIPCGMKKIDGERVEVWYCKLCQKELPVEKLIIK